MAKALATQSLGMTAPQRVQLAVHTVRSLQSAPDGGRRAVADLLTALLRFPSARFDLRHLAAVVVSLAFDVIPEETLLDLVLRQELPGNAHTIVLRSIAKHGSRALVQQLVESLAAPASLKASLLHLLMRFGRHVDAVFPSVQRQLGSAPAARLLPRCEPATVAAALPRLWAERAMKWGRLARHHGPVLLELLEQDLRDPLARRMQSVENVWRLWDATLKVGAVRLLAHSTANGEELMRLLLAYPPVSALALSDPACARHWARAQPEGFRQLLLGRPELRSGEQTWLASAAIVKGVLAAGDAEEVLAMLLADAAQMGDATVGMRCACVAAIVSGSPDPAAAARAVATSDSLPLQAAVADMLPPALRCELALASVRRTGLALGNWLMQLLPSIDFDGTGDGAALIEGLALTEGLLQQVSHDVALCILRHASPEVAARAVEPITAQLESGVTADEWLRVELLQFLDAGDANSRHVLELASFNTDDAVRGRALRCLVSSTVRLGSTAEMDVTLEFVLRRVRNERPEVLWPLLLELLGTVPGSMLSVASLKLIHDLVAANGGECANFCYNFGQAVGIKALTAAAGEIEGPRWRAAFDLLYVTYRLGYPNGNAFYVPALSLTEYDVPDELVGAWAAAFIDRRETFPPPPALDLFRTQANDRRVLWFVTAMAALGRRMFVNADLRAQARRMLWSWTTTLRGQSAYQHRIAQMFQQEFRAISIADPMVVFSGHPKSTRLIAELVNDMRMLAESSAYGPNTVPVLTELAGRTNGRWASHSDTWLVDVLRPVFYNRFRHMAFYAEQLWVQLPTQHGPDFFLNEDFATDARNLALRQRHQGMLDAYLSPVATRSARAADIIRKTDWRGSVRLSRHVLNTDPSPLLREVRRAATLDELSRALTLNRAVFRRGQFELLPSNVISAARQRFDELLCGRRANALTWYSMDIMGKFAALPGVSATDMHGLSQRCQDRIMFQLGDQSLEDSPHQAKLIRLAQLEVVKSMGGLASHPTAFHELLEILAQAAVPSDEEHKKVQAATIMAAVRELDRVVQRVSPASAVPALIAFLQSPQGSSKMVLKKCVLRSLLRAGTREALQLVCDAATAPGDESLPADVVASVLGQLWHVLRRGEAAAPAWRVFAFAAHGGDRKLQLRLVELIKGVRTLEEAVRRQFARDVLLPLLNSEHNDVSLNTAGALSHLLGLGVDEDIAAALVPWLREIVRCSNTSAYADKQWAAGVMTLVRAAAGNDGWVGARDGTCAPHLLALVEGLAEDWQAAVQALLSGAGEWEAQRGTDERLGYLLDEIPLSFSHEARLLEVVAATQQHHYRVLARRLCALRGDALVAALADAAAEVGRSPTLAPALVSAMGAVAWALPQTVDSHHVLLEAAGRMAALESPSGASAAVSLLAALSALPANASVTEARRQFLMRLARHQDAQVRSEALRMVL